MSSQLFHGYHLPLPTLYKQNKIEQLEKELKIKEESILSLKKSHEDFKKMNKQQQELISQAFHYFLKKSSQENLIFLILL